MPTTHLEGGGFEETSVYRKTRQDGIQATVALVAITMVTGLPSVFYTYYTWLYCSVVYILSPDTIFPPQHPCTHFHPSNQIV